MDILNSNKTHPIDVSHRDVFEDVRGADTSDNPLSKMDCNTAGYYPGAENVRNTDENPPHRECVRYAILSSFDGSMFSGWQRQKNAESVQQTLEDAWSRLTGETIQLTGGSRTDAGVSAERHVSSFVSSTPIPEEKIALAWNTVLPEGVAVSRVLRVPESFNPRYDALGKEYRYRMMTGAVRPVLLRHLVTHVPGRLDIHAMRDALPYFLGTHNFLSMMDQGSPTKRPVRTLRVFELVEEDAMLTLVVRGDGFLYHMVRILAGTLTDIGKGRIAPADVPGILANMDRRCAGPTMPPEGLTLERVYFAETLFGEDRWPYDDPRRVAGDVIPED